jgi:hypothetical protein
VEGADAARRWEVWIEGEMTGDDEDDFRDDLRGLPLESKIGVEFTLGKLGLGEFAPLEWGEMDDEEVDLPMGESGEGFGP